MTMGISNTGQSAEDRFLKATGATKSLKAGDGDAVLGGSNVEVKKATTPTINQVRAVKYIPLVVLHETTGKWYVVPAHQVVCLVSSKSRGQHTENPFESATLSISALGKYERQEKDLKQATLDAIAEAGKYPRLKAALEKVLKESKDLADKSIKDVTAILKQLNITP
jgi:hypothetical protein